MLKKLKLYSILIIAILVLSCLKAFAQYGETAFEQKAKFLYEIPKYLLWENDEEISTIVIAVVNADSDFLRLLKREARKGYPASGTKLTVKNFVSVSDALYDRSFNILYVPFAADYKEARDGLKRKPIAIVSDNCEDSKSVMINFVDEKTGLVSFCFSSANLRKVGISVHPNMTKELHGDDISKDEIIQEQSKQLSMTQKELLQKEKELNSKQKLLDQREREIFQKQQQIEKQNRSMELQNRAIQNQAEKLEKQRQEMLVLKNKQLVTMQELEETEQNLEKKNREAIQVSEELEKQRAELVEQQKVALDQQMHIEQVNKEISEKEDELLKLNIRNKLLNNIILVSSIVLGIFLIMIFIIAKLYMGKRKDNEKLAAQNEKIEKQNIEITAQKDEITAQNDKIIESIRYAQKIQQAVMPPEEYFSKYLPSHFIMLKPRDIVSGDFYWGNDVDDKFVFTAADCTGHGVPGAFMSLLGIAFLNDITARMSGDNITAGEILTQLRADIITYLRQSGKEDEQKDGMDMAICVYDKKTSKIQYAGAHNPLIFIRDGKLTQIDADEMPIGYYENQTERFTNHEFEVIEGDMIYMFSDGYSDQFGMVNGKRKKYMIKQFREFLLKIHNEELQQQKQMLDDNLVAWRGKLKQLDDVLVMGVRF